MINYLSTGCKWESHFKIENESAPYRENLILLKRAFPLDQSTIAISLFHTELFPRKLVKAQTELGKFYLGRTILREC